MISISAINLDTSKITTSWKTSLCLLHKARLLSDEKYLDIERNLVPPEFSVRYGMFVSFSLLLLLNIDLLKKAQNIWFSSTVSLLKS